MARLAQALCSLALTSIGAGAVRGAYDPATVFAVAPRTFFGSHHKSGTSFAGHTARCLTLPTCDGEARKSAKWDGNVPVTCDRVVHMVRSPVEVVRSGYLYHLQGPLTEPWLRRAMSGIDFFAPLKGLVEPPLFGESYHAYLNRVSESEGILAEMARSQVMNIREMEQAYLASRTHPHVLTLCLDDVFSDFGGATARLLRHLGLSSGDADGAAKRDCVEKLNPAAGGVHSEEHVTHRDSARNERIVDLITKFDETVFNKSFSESPIARFCSSSRPRAQGD